MLCYGVKLFEIRNLVNFDSNSGSELTTNYLFHFINLNNVTLSLFQMEQN